MAEEAQALAMQQNIEAARQAALFRERDAERREQEETIQRQMAVAQAVAEAQAQDVAERDMVHERIQAQIARQHQAGATPVGQSSSALGLDPHEIELLFRAAAQIEAIIPPLALLLSYKVRFVGSKGILRDQMYMLNTALENFIMPGNAGISSLTGAGGASQASPIPQPQKISGKGGLSSIPKELFGGSAEVKPLAIWQLFLMILCDLILLIVLLQMFIMIMIVPTIILGTTGGAIAIICSSTGDMCNTFVSWFGSIFH